MSSLCTTRVARDGYVSVFGAARVSGYSRRMLRHLIKTGELPAFRSGRRSWKIKLGDVYDCLYRRMRQGKLRKTDAFFDFTAALASPPTNRPDASISDLTRFRSSTIYSTGPEAVLIKGESHAHTQEPTEVHK